MPLLVLSGGRHPYHESTPILGDFLRKDGHEVTITEEAAVPAYAVDLHGYDAVVFNWVARGSTGMARSLCCYWGMMGGAFRPRRFSTWC